MTLGSLFDGSGGFPLAGAINGITPVWSSEIEPFPLRVTAARFPHVEQLGDVTKIDGAKIKPVDIITFGSPCQDLSVAGKRAGIHEGQRSSLFFEAIRIIKEMRNATDTGTDQCIRPRFAVWENVPGAFSSNKGADFRAVLEAFCRVKDPDAVIPEPKGGRWTNAGCVVGSGYSVAWRVYDAQYWGVPQRRKRIYLIADFGSERAGEILFERESVSGDIAQSGEAGQGTPADAEGSAGRSSLFEPMSLMEENWAAQDVKNALRANGSKSGHCIIQDEVKCLNPWDNQDTLNTIDRPAVVYPEKARSLCARYDSSPCIDRGQETVCYRQTGFADYDEGCGTLRASGDDLGGGTESIVVTERTNDE